MTVEDQYRYMISGYLGVKEFDTYELNLYVLKDMEQYIRDFINDNPSNNFNFDEEIERIEKDVPYKTKLQDALLLLNKIEAPMELVFNIKHKLKELKDEENK